MAKLALSILGWVPFLSNILVHLTVFTKGDLLTPPENVHFQLEFLYHILKWSHNRSGSDGIMYQVEYLRYGSDWTSVPNCTLISHQSCDLTEETLPDSPGYFARVRSVLGDRASEWTRTSRYTTRNVRLPAPSVQVDVDGPSLLVQLTLPKIRGKNVTRSLEDFFPVNRMYTIFILRTSDNYMFTQVKSCERFHITDLVDGQEYCIKIQPSISTRDNAGEVSSETCIYLPEQGVSNSILLVVASCMLAFVVLLICINIFICLYVRGVVKTPKTLKSLIQRSWSWMDKPSSPVIETTLHWEYALTEHLTAEPKDSVMRSSADSGFGSLIFVSNMSKSSEESSVGERVSNTPEDSCERESSKSEDSGISLSTDSQDLSSCTDRDIQSCGNCSETISVNDKQCYLGRKEPEENMNNLQIKNLESMWEPQIKEYLSQGPYNLQKVHVEFPKQEELNCLLEPWTQIPEAIQSSLPLTVSFSHFNNKLWDLGVHMPSLGDVEIIDTRS